jgi:hypothetical protein
MTTKKYLLLVFCILLCNLAFSQQEIDTTKCIMFLDNKRVYAKEIYKGFENETIEYYSGASSVRDILLKYGEKYRNFELYFFVTRKKEKDEEND